MRTAGHHVPISGSRLLRCDLSLPSGLPHIILSPRCSPAPLLTIASNNHVDPPLCIAEEVRISPLAGSDCSETGLSNIFTCILAATLRLVSGVGLSFSGREVLSPPGKRGPPPKTRRSLTSNTSLAPTTLFHHRTPSSPPFRHISITCPLPLSVHCLLLLLNRSHCTHFRTPYALEPLLRLQRRATSRRPNGTSQTHRLDRKS